MDGCPIFTHVKALARLDAPPEIVAIAADNGSPRTAGISANLVLDPVATHNLRGQYLRPTDHLAHGVRVERKLAVSPFDCKSPFC